MRTVIHIALTACFLLLSLDGMGQLSKKNFQQYGELEGTIILDIIADRTGQLWIATLGGLLRFDGYEFEKMQLRTEDGMGISRPNILHEDKSGRIWIGCSTDHEVYVVAFDPVFETLTSYLYTTLLVNPVHHRVINTMTSDNSGRVFFGVKGRVLDERDQSLWQPGQPLIYYEPDEDRLKVWADETGEGLCDVYLSANDPEGNVWFVSGYGVFRKDSALSVEQMHVRQGTGDKRATLISGITARIKGELWMIKGDSLLMYDIHSNISRAWMHPDLQSRMFNLSWGLDAELAVDRDTNIWIGVDTEVLKFDRSDGRFENVNAGIAEGDITSEWGLGEHVVAIRSMHADIQGNVWIGTNKGDLVRLSPMSFFHTLTSGMLLRDWPILYEMGENEVWLGNASDNLTNVFYLKSGELWRGLPEPWRSSYCDICRVPGPYSKTELLSINQGKWWAMDKRTFDLRELHLPGLPDDLPGMQEKILIDSYSSDVDAKDRTWICTLEGVFILDGDGNRLGHVSLDRNTEAKDSLCCWIKDIYFGNSFDAWFTTSTGLYSYGFEDDTLARHGYDLSYGDIFPDQNFNGFYEARDGAVWVGHGDRGLSKYNPGTGAIQTYTLDDGLPDMAVQTILGDEKHGALWLSTLGGLSRFDIAQDEFVNFSKRDGIQGLIFQEKQCLITASGHYFFAGQNGATYFHPDSFAGYSLPPELRFTEIRYVNDPITPEQQRAFRNKANVGGKITLKHSQNSLLVGYTGIHYDDPQNNKYAYMLEPFNDAWLKVGNQRTAQFTSLPPGEYVFKVKAANRHGEWGKEPMTFSIHVLPPWWGTWWAYISYFVIAALGIWQVARLYKIRTQKKEREEARRRLEDARTRFFTNVSHELRTPVTIINGMAGEMETNPRAPELIQRNADILKGLIEQIFDLEKFDAGTLKANYVQGDIIAYLRYVCEIYETSATQKGLHFSRRFPEAFVMDYDPEKTLRIVGNLLQNAIKFTPSGGSVEVRVLIDHKDGSEVFNMHVRDSGIGIPETELNKVFQRYYQVTHPTTIAKDSSGGVVSSSYWSSGSGGTGIGLAIVKDYVSLLGGEVSVISDPGKGTTFSVMLPVHRKAMVEDVNAKLPGMMFQPQLLNHDISENGVDEDLPEILIIEDSPDMITYIQTCLGGAYRFRTAMNGNAGIEEALEHIPDVIISDVMMPELGGFELCNALKSDVRTSHIPIILLTAKADTESRLRGLSTGADAYLIKPFNKSELLIRLDAMIALRRKLQERYSQLSVSQESSDGAVSPDDAFIQRVREIIVAHLDDVRFNTRMLGEACAMSERHMQLKIKALTGKTPALFIRALRLEKAMELLDHSDLRVNEIAYRSGFSDPAYFTRAFTGEYGMSPTAWRNIKATEE